MKERVFERDNTFDMRVKCRRTQGEIQALVKRANGNRSTANVLFLLARQHLHPSRRMGSFSLFPCMERDSDAAVKAAMTP